MLVTCPECGAKISEQANPCPKCGCFNAGFRSKENAEKTILKWKREEEGRHGCECGYFGKWRKDKTETVYEEGGYKVYFITRCPKCNRTRTTSPYGFLSHD